MVTSEFVLPSAEPPEDPRTVSRGSKVQLGFLGIDSLYLVLEYPHLDIFKSWSRLVRDARDTSLHTGIVFDDFVVRGGANGYKLSLWDGDARLYLTDRVDEQLENTPMAGQGMGVMLQLGPKWLRKFGDIVSPEKLIQNVLAQFTFFGIRFADTYPARINRLDINLDVLGLRVADFSIDEWRSQWVGHARQKNFHDSALTGELEGLSIGSSEGTIRFKVYDKVVESHKSGSSDFWRSVWGLTDDQKIDVARFEWSIRVYRGGFEGIRYLTDLSFEHFLDLLNYASLTWGRLCIPEADDTNKSRWELAPLWQEIRQLIDDWSINYKKAAKREYDYKPDLKPMYLRTVAGWLGGFMARVGIELDIDSPSALITALDILEQEGISINRKAKAKWDLLSRLAGGGHSDVP